MRMNTQDFANKFLDSDLYQDYLENTADRIKPFKIFQIMMDEADRLGIELVNTDLFDYEDFFYMNIEELEELNFS